MINLKYENSQEAWEKLNAFFLNKEGYFNDSKEKEYKDGDIVSGQRVSYDTNVFIHKAWVLPDFDFGNTFGYRAQKWSGLVNNYINVEYLKDLKKRVQERENKNSRHYNISMPFDNSHGHGKNCLLSLTITRRQNKETPLLSFTLRSSEITKRLLMDFLLVQRVGEYVFENKTDFSLNMVVINMYQDPEAFTMFDSFKPIRSIMVKDGRKSKYQKKVLGILRKFKRVDLEEIKYKVHKRCVRQLQRPNGHPLSGDRPMYSRELNFTKLDI